MRGRESVAIACACFRVLTSSKQGVMLVALHPRERGEGTNPGSFRQALRIPGFHRPSAISSSDDGIALLVRPPIALSSST